MKGTLLNQLCDGTLQIPVKGSEAVLFKGLVICSGNKIPSEIYNDATSANW